MRRIFAAILVLAGALIPLTLARAEHMLSVREFLASYDKHNAIERGLEQGELRAFMDALMWTNTYMIGVRKERPLFCQPDELSIEPAQLVRMLRDAAKDSDFIADAPFGMGVLLTFQKVFPCTS
jgi:hypothetical protein